MEVTHSNFTEVTWMTEIANIITKTLHHFTTNSRLFTYYNHAKRAAMAQW